MSQPSSEAFPNPFVARRKSLAKPVLAATAALLLALLVGLCASPSGVDVPLGDVAKVILRNTPLLAGRVAAPEAPESEAIVWDLRLPRLAGAALIGAVLAMAGLALQGLLMNPLADPYTVGVSAGSAVGAALAEILGLSLLLHGLGVPALAFAGGLGAVSLVYAVARVGGRVTVQTFLLAGVVVGTLLWSLIPLLMTVTGRAEDMQRVMFFLIGNLQGVTWDRVQLLAPFLLLSWVCLRLWSRDLNLMSLGEETAGHLGVDVERFKRRVLLVGSLATAAAVSVGGIIGFVGLVVPHAARRLVGPDHQSLLPLCVLLGATLLVLADSLTRVWLNDLPVGVITAIIGAPVFCLLLRRRRAVAW
jgi:iron complex transport system permease protein